MRSPTKSHNDSESEVIAGSFDVDGTTCGAWLNDGVIHAAQVLMKKADDLAASRTAKPTIGSFDIYSVLISFTVAYIIEKWLHFLIQSLCTSYKLTQPVCRTF